MSFLEIFERKQLAGPYRKTKAPLSNGQGRSQRNSGGAGRRLRVASAWGVEVGESGEALAAFCSRLCRKALVRYPNVTPRVDEGTDPEAKRMTVASLLERLHEADGDAEIVVWDARQSAFTNRLIIHRSALGGEVVLIPLDPESDLPSAKAQSACERSRAGRLTVSH